MNLRPLLRKSQRALRKCRCQAPYARAPKIGTYFRKFGPNISYPEPEYGGAVISALVSAKSLKCFTPAAPAGAPIAPPPDDIGGPHIGGIGGGMGGDIGGGMPRDIGALHIGDMGDMGGRR